MTGVRRAGSGWWLRGWPLAVVAGLVMAAGPGAVPTAGDVGSSGSVIAWGDDNDGQIDVPAGLTGVTAISAGAVHNLALRSDGTVVAWGGEGNTDYGQTDVPAGLSDVVAVSAGDYHSLALKDDGTVVAWGCHGADYGQCDVPTGLTDAIAVSAGGFHSLALKHDGTVVAWGATRSADYGQANVPADLGDVIAVSAGGYHSLALKDDGTVVAWGYDTDHQSSVPSELTGVAAISAGSRHSLALKDDGTVVAWGDNSGGQTDVPPGLTEVASISAGDRHNIVGTNDGKAIAWGVNTSGEAVVPVGLTGVGKVSAGASHNLVLGTLAPSRPDLLISTAASSGYQGNDLYNGTGAGQTKSTTAKRGQTRTFYVRVANDGTGTGRIVVKGGAAPTNSTVKYLSSGADVTSAIRSTAGWRATLDPGAYTTLKVTVKIGAKAKFGSQKAIKITGSWGGTPSTRDAVKAAVTVRK